MTKMPRAPYGQVRPSRAVSRLPSGCKAASMTPLLPTLPLLLPTVVASDFEAYTFWPTEVNAAVWEASLARAKEVDAAHCAWHCMDLQEDGGTCDAITFDPETGLCLMGQGLEVGAPTTDTGLRVAWASSNRGNGRGVGWFAVDKLLRAQTEKLPFTTFLKANTSLVVE